MRRGANKIFLHPVPDVTLRWSGVRNILANLKAMILLPIGSEFFLAIVR